MMSFEELPLLNRGSSSEFTMKNSNSSSKQGQNISSSERSSSS